MPWPSRSPRCWAPPPVLTTASDVGKTIPVDILGRELGWKVEAPKLNITRVSAHVVNGEPVAVVQEAGSPRLVDPADAAAGHHPQVRAL